jgi:hypothetical protein
MGSFFQEVTAIILNRAGRSTIASAKINDNGIGIG